MIASGGGLGGYGGGLDLKRRLLALEGWIGPDASLTVHRPPAVAHSPDGDAPRPSARPST